jgi:ubiquinone/menaquinone biosynthesis C-methylase UbiE
MTQKFNSEEQLAPRDLAQHLRKPDGETGKKIGVMMNKGNNHICLNTYKLLDPQEGDHVLEIGMGNGFFVKDLLTMSKGLTLTGVDFSPTMVEEANVLNEAMVAKNVARFICASVEELPFPDSQFNMATSTNTIYFWPDPENNARELLRVLKKGGKLVLG